jgi:hypothetical protein
MEIEKDIMSIKNDFDNLTIYKNLLLDLPIEIFLKICTYLSSRVIIKNLSLVCKHLNNIIKNDSSWKHRIFNRWPKKYPPVYCKLLQPRFCVFKIHFLMILRFKF